MALAFETRIPRRGARFWGGVGVAVLMGWAGIGEKKVRGADGAPTQGGQSAEQVVAAGREVLKGCDREKDPQRWAVARNKLAEGLHGLGLAWREEAGHCDSDKAVTMLGQAKSAYGEALTIYTREQSPQEWAKTQVDLGDALTDLAGHSTGKPSVALLRDAVNAFRGALMVYYAEQSPLVWATTQDHLGTALRLQAVDGEKAAAVPLLQEAVTAYREALKVFTRERYPLYWAWTQNDLGVALSDEAARVDGKPQAAVLLEEAVEADKSALLVYTKDFQDRHDVVARHLAEHEEALGRVRGSGEK